MPLAAGSFRTLRIDLYCFVSDTRAQTTFDPNTHLSGDRRQRNRLDFSRTLMESATFVSRPLSGARHDTERDGTRGGRIQSMRLKNSRQRYSFPFLTALEETAGSRQPEVSTCRPCSFPFYDFSLLCNVRTWAHFGQES